ncbi:hypothetical protein FGO68_gene2060 [Halteria grandinella]|uniref:Uncharacterized protein n=1 Tax=Halteria grandinella TaxID=5974 RepID=A0A8J8NR20_HALGN|nr:hypothetical protein FGO68_gene2060 [Halteria grandinella]
MSQITKDEQLTNKPPQCLPRKVPQNSINMAPFDLSVRFAQSQSQIKQSFVAKQSAKQLHNKKPVQIFVGLEAFLSIQPEKVQAPEPIKQQHKWSPKTLALESLRNFSNMKMIRQTTQPFSGKNYEHLSRFTIMSTNTTPNEILDWLSEMAEYRDSIIEEKRLEELKKKKQEDAFEIDLTESILGNNYGTQKKQPAVIAAPQKPATVKRKSIQGTKRHQKGKRH